MRTTRFVDPTLDRRYDRGPFDLIGDVHGCFDELRELLAKLGYSVAEAVGSAGPRFHLSHPQRRRPILLGDLVDRGPEIPRVLRLAMDCLREGSLLAVIGNHDDKLKRKLHGHDVKIAHGLAESLAELDREGPLFKEQVRRFLDRLPLYYLLDGWRLVAVHAGLKESMQGHCDRRVREFALYGDTTGEVDDVGLPIRRNWAEAYRGRATVVHGHVYVETPQWLNNVIDLDTGCVFGGALTALRYPERELVSVPARRAYWQALRSPSALLAGVDEDVA